MFNRYTERARKVILLAQEEAKRFSHDHVGTEHLLLGVLRAGESVATAVFVRGGISVESMREEVQKRLGPGSSSTTSGVPPWTPRARDALTFAAEEASGLGHNYIGPEHLLLGLLRESDHTASQILLSFGIELGGAREHIKILLGGPTPVANKPHSDRQQVIEDLEQDIARIRQEREAAVIDGDFGRAASLRDVERAVREQLKQIREEVQRQLEKPEDRREPA